MWCRFIVLGLILAAPFVDAQDKNAVFRWKLAPGHYAAYAIDGKIGVEHLGFFGYDVKDGRSLGSEPVHPAFLSLALVTFLPDKPAKPGLRIKYRRVFTHFENYTPVKVRGTFTVAAMTSRRMSMEGSFELREVDAQPRDPRYYQIKRGKLRFTSEWDLLAGMLLSATVRYDYVYDWRTPLAELYTDRDLGCEKNVTASLSHTYTLTGIMSRRDLPWLVDGWVDQTRDRMIKKWKGKPAKGQNLALRTGYDGLYVKALLHAQASKTHPAIRRAMERLRRGEIHSTYSAALLLMALEAYYTPVEELRNPGASGREMSKRHPSDEDRRLVKKAVRYLVEGQVGGGWTYGRRSDDQNHFGEQSGEAPDNSNTQFALMGLHAAGRMGVRVDAKVWTKAVSFWAQRRCPRGFRPPGEENDLRGWAYHGSNPYGSMTAGALASLSIIAAELGSPCQIRRAVSRRTSELMTDAKQWLSYHYTVRQCRGHVLLNRGLGEDWAYHLYALERAFDLTGVKKIGPHDWYGEGAMAILHGTYPDSDRDFVYESLCLLFLRRSTPPAVTTAAR